MHKMDKSMSNTVYIAAAGSGKTTLLVKKACEIKNNIQSIKTNKSV